MTIRSVLPAAIGCVAALILTGCSSSIAGSPQALLPADAAASQNGPSNGSAGVLETPALSLPSPGGQQPSADPGELPDLSQALGDLGALGSLGDLGSLGNGQSLDPSQLSELLGSLGGSGSTDGLAALGNLVSPECLSILGASMSLGTLLLSPMMGKPLTSAEVDKAFNGLKDVPSDVAGAVKTLRQAADAAVGKPAAAASELLSAPAVSDAMDQLSEYMDTHCGGQ